MTKEKESKTEDIHTALLKFQANEWLVAKDSNNPFFKSKYADLEAVSKVCRKALNESGIILNQLPIFNELGAGCETILTHANSGTELRNTLVLPLSGKHDAQAVGSCITYARRYAICSMLGLVAAEEDDDGNAASGKIDVKDRDLNTGGSWPTVSGKKYPLGKKDGGFKKDPLANDDIPEFETAKAVFPDSQEIKIHFKYDIDNLDPSKVEDVEKYIEGQKQNGYIDLDYTTGVIESELELPKLKRYQIFPE